MREGRVSSLLEGEVFAFHGRWLVIFKKKSEVVFMGDMFGIF